MMEKLGNIIQAFRTLNLILYQCLLILLEICGVVHLMVVYASSMAKNGKSSETKNWERVSRDNYTGSDR